MRFTDSTNTCPILTMGDEGPTMTDADTELSLEPTVSESSTPESTPAAVEPVDPVALAELVSESAHRLADEAAKLPGLQEEKEDLENRIACAQLEYSAGMKKVADLFGSRMEPISEEMKDIDTAIESAQKAKKKLQAMAQRAALAHFRFETTSTFISAADAATTEKG